MGYDADGDLEITFASPARRSDALAALNAALATGRHSWGKTVPADDFVDALERFGFDVWDGDPGDECVEFAAQTSGRWGDDQETFGDIVTAYAATVSGSFTGSDGESWTWEKTASSNDLVTEAQSLVSGSEYRRLTEDRDALTAILAAAVTGTDAVIASTVRIALASRTDDEDVLVVLSQDPDPAVRDAATARIVRAARA